MNHPYLRAYMAGISLPTPLLLLALTLFFIARFVYNVPVPVERAIIFPMAIIPNLFGVWNMFYQISHSRTHLSLGVHGAILPFLIAPAGFFLGRCLGFLHAGSHGLIYFGFVQIPYLLVAVVFPTAQIVYYLVWKYVIGYLNRVAGVAR